jgi:hypothetical protein
MKYEFFIVGIMIFVISCAESTNKRNIISKNTKLDSELIELEKKTKDSIDNKSKENYIGYKKYNTEYEYYMDIYRQEKLIDADDILMLSITDSLFTENRETELFYFVVFTKSMNGSDGFYSEALGTSCYKFITTKTNKFTEHFLKESKLTETDLKSWAECIFGEIQIAKKNSEIEAIKELEKELLENINESSESCKKIVLDLIVILKELNNKSKAN